MKFLYHYHGKVEEENGKQVLKKKGYYEIDVDIGTEGRSAKGPFVNTSPFALSLAELNAIKFDGDLYENLIGKQGLTRQENEDFNLSMSKRTVVNPFFQYNELADPRTDKDTPNIGNVYRHTLHSNMPIVFIRPGKVKFYGTDSFFTGGSADGKGSNDNIKSALLNHLKDDAAAESLGYSDISSSNSEYENLIKDLKKNGSSTKFYDFQPDYLTFKKYAGSLLKELIARMGMVDQYSEGENFIKKLSTPMDDWYKRYSYVEKSNENIAAFLPFRVEKTSDISESFNTSTGPSSLINNLKAPLDQIREYNFLSGAGADKGIISKLGGAATGAASAFINGITGSEQASSMLTNNGVLLMPDVWKDSTYDRSINITIKLFSPFGNRKSIIENIYMPLIMWIALAAPRQIDSSTYVAPPLIQAHSAGWFNCDMGMITSLTVRKSTDKNDWTIDKLPKSLELTITIKDLYPTMMLSLSGNDLSQILFNRNSALTQYMNMLAGRNMFESYSTLNSWKDKFDSLDASVKHLWTAIPEMIGQKIGSIIPFNNLWAAPNNY